MHVGHDAFIRIMKLPCSKGKIKTSLSSYFFKMRDASDVFKRIIVQIGEMDRHIGVAFNRSDSSIKNDEKHLLSK